MGHTHLIPEPYHPQLLTIFSFQSTLRTWAVERESLKRLAEGGKVGQLHYVVKVISRNMFITHLTSLTDNYLGNTVKCWQSIIIFPPHFSYRIKMNLHTAQ